MSDQKNTPEAGSPPPEADRTPGAFPDLGAQSDSPAWLSADTGHDAGVWDRTFETTAGDAGQPVDQQPEPVIVAPEELELEEPSLAEPALTPDAVEAASLDEVVSETAAVEANAAEAGRLSGLEPAPAGAEIPVDTEPAAADAAPETEPEPTEDDRPLHGIDAAAPLTTPVPESPSAEPADAAEPATAPVPAGETRRSRRLAESRAAAASGATASKQPGTSTPDTAGAGADRPDAESSPAAIDAAPERTGSSRNKRLLVVIGAVALAAVIAILLFVFVFNDKGEGVISEDVSPLDLESGACLQNWEDVNSSVTVVTCETPHDAQLVASESYPEDDAFPGTPALEERVNEVCDAVDYSDAAAEFPDLKLAKSIPTEQTWASGDRRLDCFVFAPEKEEISQSLLRE